MRSNRMLRYIAALFSRLFLIPPAPSVEDAWCMVQEGGGFKKFPDNPAVLKIIPLGIEVEQFKRLFNTHGIIAYVRFYFRGGLKEYCNFLIKGRRGMVCICYEDGRPISIDSRDYICLDPAPDNPCLRRILEEIRTCCGIA